MTLKDLDFSTFHALTTLIFNCCTLELLAVRSDLELVVLRKIRLVSGMKCQQGPRPCEQSGMERLSALRQAGGMAA